MSARAVLTTAAAGLLVAGSVGGYMIYDQASEGSRLDDAAGQAAVTFARAVANRTPQSATYIGTSPAAAAANFTTATQALGSGRIQTVVVSVHRDHLTAVANVLIKWTLPNGSVFSWNDPVNLATANGAWGVKVGDTSLWHPKLQANDAFRLQLSSGQRGQILGKGGAGIMTNQTVYEVQFDPAKATVASASQLERVTGVSGLAAKVGKSTTVTPVVTYRSSDYHDRKSGLDGLAGVNVVTRTQPLAPTKTFGQPLLGSVGPVTAEQVKKDSSLTAGTYIGQGGLQKQYNKILQPTPGFTVTSRSRPDQVLFGAGGKNGSNLQTTLDPKVQTAAESALATLGTDKAAAIVAIDVPTGNVLAVANGPTYGIERAVTGHYAPGSTLKVATAYELLSAKGVTPDSKIACPQELVVDGMKVRNFEGESIGDPTFADDFAHSCNTAFVGATTGFGNSDMRDAAGALGVGGSWGPQVGVTGAYAGDVPVANGTTDKAASVFGQGRTQASPLALAVMACSVARGSFVPPALVTSPSPGGSRTPKSLDANAINGLRSMMRKTVTEGTATLMQDTPGGDVYAKTGTAEVGNAGATAWLAGWQGTVAFAVLVADVPAGQGGGTVAAPVARNFLTNLAQAG